MKKVILALPIAVVLLLAGWHSFYSYRKYNVILITTDTLRADHLSCYNADAPKTPNFDRLAAESVLFEQAYTTIPITLAAHTAILTSHAPRNLGLFNNGETYDGRYPLISALLAKQGYDTAAFISLGVLKSEFGLRDSFKVYEDHFDEHLGRYYKTAEEMNAVALPWLENEKNRRFFAWIHYSDPHEPYITADAPQDTEVLVNGMSAGKYCMGRKEKNELHFEAKPGKTTIVFQAIAPPGPKKIQEAESKRYLDPKVVLDSPQPLTLNFGGDWQDIHLSNGSQVRYFEGTARVEVLNTAAQPVAATLRFTGGVWGQRLEEVRENYEAEVQFLDKRLGKLLDQIQALGLQDRTIVILTSDHGEGLKTHGYLGHVGNLHNEVIHVPLLIRYPNLGRQGSRIKQLVNHLDIMPTILDLLHARSTGPMEGASLKYYVSRSPIDLLLSRKVTRPRTFTETYEPEAPHNSFALVEGNMKLIFTPPWKWEIYDTDQDAMEKRNIAKADGARFQSAPVMRLRNLLEEFSRESGQAHSQRKNPQLDESQREMLGVLGYVNQGQGQTKPSSVPVPEDVPNAPREKR